MYLTANVANLYIAKNLESGQVPAIHYLLSSAILSIKRSLGAVYELALLLSDMENKSFYKDIAARSTKGKPVKINVFRSNIGSGRSVFDWNGRTVLSRNGKIVSQHLTTTEKTTIYWGNGR